MKQAYAWADHRVFARGDADGGAFLFGAEQASLFAIDRATRDVLERWRLRSPIVLDDAPADDRAVLDALADAQLHAGDVALLDHVIILAGIIFHSRVRTGVSHLCLHGRLRLHGLRGLSAVRDGLIR